MRNCALNYRRLANVKSTLNHIARPAVFFLFNYIGDQLLFRDRSRGRDTLLIG